MRGSMTVEAAYLFPFCFLILGIVCYFGVFEYNRSVLKTTGYECVLHVMEQREKSDQLLQEELLRLIKQTAEERVLGMADLKVSVKFTASKISVSISGDHTMLRVPMEVTVVYERIFPELTLRLLQGI